MPVPYTGRHRGGHWFRRIRTAPARSLAQVLDQEPPPRPARGLRGIPTAWEDFVVSASSIRSWKRHRKTQRKAR